MTGSFGAALAELRRERGLNQRQLSGELKISQALLSHYENGSREPGLPFVCRVCDYFGVTADSVLGRGDSIPPLADEKSAAARLLRELSQADDPLVRKAAEDFLNAAARRVLALMHSEKGSLGAAEAAVDMSEAELRLLFALSRRDYYFSGENL